jgi:NTE family protein
MSEVIDFLLIGGGLASATAAETLRNEGAKGKITIISAENSLPYHRPPLSKNFLLKNQKAETILIRRENFYIRNKIEILLGTRALSINTASKIVETDNAGNIKFNKLLIATGSCLTRLTVPGHNLKGIYYLRTIKDAEKLKVGMADAKKALVIGASFIGMELASTLTNSGIDTTIIEKERLVYDKLNSPEISRFFIEYYRSKGVEIFLGTTVKEFRGKDHVKGVVISTGETFDCNLVAIGVGVTPETDFLRDSGISLSDGIIVDEYMETNIPDVYAAGDVANFYDPVFGRHRRIEHWDNAIKSGELAANSMMGKRQPCRGVSYFFSDVFDITFNFLGDPEHVQERIVRGSIRERKFSVLYLRESILRATFLLGRPLAEDKAVGSLILNRVNLEKVKNRLADASFQIEKIPTQVALILQGGGALGAFECGVVKAMEEKEIYPDIVAGVSIGAFNAAIIAGNPRDAAHALEGFWKDVSTDTPEVPNETLRRLFSSWYVLMFGSPRFFHPRWFKPVLNLDQLPLYWKSFYDPTPAKELLLKYVDFDNLKASPVRLLVSAVNVETGELETFDSHFDDITPDHILASGSLPPGFPWTTIKGRHYWDGGIVSNSPIDQVVELCGLAGKKIYVVNLYSGKKSIPQNMMEVLARREEIYYSEKIRKDIHTIELIENYRNLVDEIMTNLEPKISEQIQQRPHYIQTMGDTGPVSIARIALEGEEGDLPSKDYDFSRRSILEYIEEGYKSAKKILKKE